MIVSVRRLTPAARESFSPLNKSMKQSFILFSCALILATVGCGGEQRPDGMPPLNRTTLTFTQGGAPLTGATVTLSPQDGGDLSQWTYGGVTDNNGVVNVLTNGFNGVPVGTFRVAVLKIEHEGGATGEPQFSNDDRGVPAAASTARSFHVVDPKFRSVATTDLTLEVRSGRNSQTFDLGSAIREVIPVFTN